MTTCRIVLWGAIASIASVTAAGAATSEEGGSGLLRVDYAWSMPVTDLILGIDTGYFSHDFTPGTDRFVRMTPSLTKGLGGGFEGSAALPFDGISQNLDRDEDGFDRRIDIRRRDLLAKLRWSGSLGSPRARFGAQGGVGLPLSSSQKTRAGGTEKPDDGYDLSASGLFSADIGWFDFPVRVHLNGGYFWSRNDGAVYYQDHPLAIPIDGSAVTDNDVATAGVAIEAGLRRFVAFGELTTEQLMGARAQVRGKENLWRLTPGIRTEVGSDIALTAAVSFNLASDDDRTEFNPNDVYPDFELRVGLSLGNVLSRNKYEDRKRTRPATSWPIVSEASQEKAAEEDAAALAAAVEPSAKSTDPAAAEPDASPAAESSVASAASAADLTATASETAAKPSDTTTAPAQTEPSVVEAVEAPVVATAPVAAPEAPIVQAPRPPMEVAPAPAQPAPAGGASIDEIERRVDERLARFELGVRLALLESRIAQVERGPATTTPAWVGSSAATPSPAPPGPAADAPKADAIAAEMKALQDQIAALRAEMSAPRIAAAAAPATVPATEPATEPADAATMDAAAATAASARAAMAADEEAKRELAALRAEIARVRADADSARAIQARRETAARMAAYEAQIRELRESRAAADGAETKRAIAALEREIAALRSSPVVVTAPASSAPAAPPTVVNPSSPAVVVTPPAVPVASPAASGSSPATASSETDARVEALIAQLESVGAGTSGASRGATPDTAPTLEPFPLRIGEIASVQGNTDAVATSLVTEWAPRLRNHPSIRVSLVVHGGGPNPAGALVETDADAKRWQQMFVAAGVPSSQVVPLGMGLTEVGQSGTQRIELERIQ